MKPGRGRSKKANVAPAEVRALPAEQEEYLAWRAATDLRGPYRILPTFMRGTKKEADFDNGEVPLIVFINARSGGRVGPRLATKLARALGKSQVFDLGVNRPEKVLRQLWENFSREAAAGSTSAPVVRSRLRILVAGGDGTIAWILKTIQQLELTPAPAVAMMPLGTGNDLSRTFDWGAAFDWAWVRGHAGVYSTLKRIADASVTNLDCWELRVSLPARRYLTAHTYALTEVEGGSRGGSAGGSAGSEVLAHLAAGDGTRRGYGTQPLSPVPASPFSAGGAPQQQRTPFSQPPQQQGPADSQPAAGASGVGSSDGAAAAAGAATGADAAAAGASGGGGRGAAVGTSGGGASAVDSALSGSSGGGARPGPVVMEGMFWNYFSVGADAQAAFGFHSLREQAPGCTAHRVQNQFWYSFFSCASGWFCNCTPSIGSFAPKVEVQGADGSWRGLSLPSAVQALVVVNLQSYAGGRNIWGSASANDADGKRHGWQPPQPDDGLIEVVGFRSGMHAATVMATFGKLMRGERLAQVHGIRIHLKAASPDGAADRVFMQVDGEPWQQDIPGGVDEAPIVVEISHVGKSKVLRNNGDLHQAPTGLLEVIHSDRKLSAAINADVELAQSLERISKRSTGSIVGALQRSLSHNSLRASLDTSEPARQLSGSSSTGRGAAGMGAGTTAVPGIMAVDAAMSKDLTPADVEVVTQVVAAPK